VREAPTNKPLALFDHAVQEIAWQEKAGDKSDDDEDHGPIQRSRSQSTYAGNQQRKTGHAREMDRAKNDRGFSRTIARMHQLLLQLLCLRRLWLQKLVQWLGQPLGDFRSRTVIRQDSRRLSTGSTDFIATEAT